MRFIFLTMLMIAAATWQRTAPADDVSSGNSDAPAIQSGKQQAGDGDGGELPAKKPVTSKADRDLLKDLVPDLPLPDDSSREPAGDENAPDELDRAVKAMRDAAGRLRSRDASDETRGLQTAAKEDIQKLIEKLRQPPPPSSSSSQSSQDQQSQDRSQSRQQQRSSSSQQKQEQQASSQGQSGTPMPQRTDSKAAESEEQNDRQAREHATALARRRALINEIWGHLPPSMREKLMNVRGEKTLPQYEDLIRKYYEALAESASGPPSTASPR